MSSSSSTAFWSYLPAFIAVAETEHLRKAAQTLHVSPSALSRTIAILEHRIGYSLFERAGRRLRLTSRGERLLRVLRRSTLMLDETLDAAGVTQHEVVQARVVKSSALG
jgi:LysR family glycine cleavage system transcriptional activator